MNKTERLSKYRSRKTSVLLLMLFSAVFSYGQQMSVTGKVMDSTNEPVIGATIQVKGASTGTVTDVDGNFRITVADAAKVHLVVSYIGYETQEERDV